MSTLKHSVETGNPFVHRFKLTNLQKIQVAVMSVTVAPIRAIFAFLLFVTAWFLALFFTIGADFNQPAGPVRTVLYGILQKLGRVIMFFCGFHWCTVKGKRVAFNEAPVLLVVPHSSYWDISVFFVSLPFPCALSKQENFRIPIFGTLMKAVQPILVQRNDALSKHDTMDAIRNRLTHSCSWPQLVIFPEGTCTNKNYMIKFKLGAFLSGTPIQPTIIRYKSSSFDTTTWTETSPSAFLLIWLTLCQIHTSFEIEYLDVYKPSVIERNDPKLYANNVQKYLAKLLNVPCIDYTYEDRLLMKLAGKLKFPKEAAILPFFPAAQTWKINIRDVMERLTEFAQISSDRSDGKASGEDFAKFLGVPMSLDVKALFNKFDNDNSGVISFYQYVMGYYKISKEVATDENIKLACDVLQKRDKSSGKVLLELLFNKSTANVQNIDAEQSVEMNGKLIVQLLQKNPLQCMYLLNKNATYSSVDITSDVHCAVTLQNVLRQRN